MGIAPIEIKEQISSCFVVNASLSEPRRRKMDVVPSSWSEIDWEKHGKRNEEKIYRIEKSDEKRVPKKSEAAAVNCK